MCWAGCSPLYCKCWWRSWEPLSSNCATLAVFASHFHSSSQAWRSFVLLYEEFWQGHRMKAPHSCRSKCGQWIVPELLSKTVWFCSRNGTEKRAVFRQDCHTLDSSWCVWKCLLHLVASKYSRVCQPQPNLYSYCQSNRLFLSSAELCCIFIALGGQLGRWYFWFLIDLSGNF